MKLLFIIGFLLIFSRNLSIAQSMLYIGSSIDTISKNLLNRGYEVSEKIDKDGDLYISVYVSEDKTDIIYYFSKFRLCTMINIITFKDKLIGLIKNNNKNLIKIEAMKWIDKDGTYSVSINIPEDQDFFVMSIKSLL